MQTTEAIEQRPKFALTNASCGSLKVIAMSGFH